MLLIIPHAPHIALMARSVDLGILQPLHLKLRISGSSVVPLADGTLGATAVVWNARQD